MVGNTKGLSTVGAYSPQVAPVQPSEVVTQGFLLRLVMTVLASLRQFFSVINLLDLLGMVPSEKSIARVDEVVAASSGGIIYGRNAVGGRFDHFRANPVREERARNIGAEALVEFSEESVDELAATEMPLVGDLIPVEADPVREERVRNIADDLYAWGVDNVIKWLCHASADCESGGIVQIFLALREKDADFADKVLAAAKDTRFFKSISLITEILSDDEAIRTRALEKWAGMNSDNTCIGELVQIFEHVRGKNVNLAQQMRTRMKGDEFFGLYLRIMAAAKNPSEAAKMVTGKDGNLTNIGALILQWLPTTVATRIFLAIPSSEGDGEGAQLEFIGDHFSWLFPWLLCGMEPKQAVDMLLKVGHYNDVPDHYYCHSAKGFHRFIRFMRFSPEATARILAHMLKDVVKSILNERECSDAVVAEVTPFLQKFNSELAAQLFSENLQDILEGKLDKNLPRSVLLSMNPEEVVSLYRQFSSDKNLAGIAFGHAIRLGNVVQMRKFVQILKALLQEGLLDYEKDAKRLFTSVNEWPNEYDLYDDRDWDRYRWNQMLGENLPDDVLAQFVCHLNKKWQKEILLTLPSERRKTIQNLIVPISAAEP